MISIPPYFLLFPFGAFLLAFIFFSLANIVSLAKYGARNAIGLLVTFVFVCVTLMIGFYGWRALEPIAWTAPVPLFEVEIPAI
ncbi:MAG: hypothetical protein QY323_04755 [Patescibacteria group bacterium]|nr:MAG: hypothetical protein QY323_04755 [Patescibacteria group bacterium]